MNKTIQQTKSHEPKKKKEKLPLGKFQSAFTPDAWLIEMVAFTHLSFHTSIPFTVSHETPKQDRQGVFLSPTGILFTKEGLTRAKLPFPAVTTGRLE